MRRKNKGFTLAEVLITLGIIGVIAALTLPTLIQNANSAKTGPELASAVSTLENAIQQFMTDYNADYVYVAMRKAGSDSYSIDTLINNYLFNTNNPYIKGSTIDNPPTSSIQWKGSEAGYASSSTAVRMLANKSLIASSVDGEDGKACVFSDTDTTSKCGIIFYTSGFQKKQDEGKLITGRDVFKIWVTNRGEVLPDGTSETGNLWSDKGNCDKAGMEDGSASGLGCAGRIAANGWKVDY